MCCFSWFAGTNGFMMPWGFFFFMPFVFMFCMFFMWWIFRRCGFFSFVSRREKTLGHQQLVHEIRQLRLEIEKIKSEK
jgi:hypothetical protein